MSNVQIRSLGRFTAGGQPLPSRLSSGRFQQKVSNSIYLISSFPFYGFSLAQSKYGPYAVLTEIRSLCRFDYRSGMSAPLRFLDWRTHLLIPFLLFYLGAITTRSLCLSVCLTRCTFLPEVRLFPPPNDLAPDQDSNSAISSLAVSPDQFPTKV